MGQISGNFLKLARWSAYVGVALLGMAMLVTVGDVILRGATRFSNLFLDNPIGMAIPGVVDIVQLFVMGVVFLTIPFAFMTDSQVSVDLVTARMRPRREAFFKGMGALLSAAFMIAVLRYGWDQAMLQLEYGDSSSTLEIPMIVFWTLLLAGAALSVMATVLISLEQFAFGCFGRAPIVSPTDEVKGEL